MPAYPPLGIVEAPSAPHLDSALVPSRHHHLHVALVLSALYLAILMSSHPNIGVAAVYSLHPDTALVPPLHLDPVLISSALHIDAVLVPCPAHLDIVPAPFARHLHTAVVHMESSVPHLHIDMVSAAFHSHIAGVLEALYLGTGAMS
uniref:Uncharacterized protein n=1 Tax=Arundo donax TaxID=35708 RepID=A0A0A9DF20_ARUDO